MRLRLALGLSVVLGLAAGLKYKLLLGLVGPDTLWTLLGIDAAALLLLLVYSVAALTAHLTALREMLNSLDIYIDGRHEHRLPVQGSGLLTDLSRRMNEVLSHDAEGEEMNSATPGIKRVVRPAEVTDPHRRGALLSSPQAANETAGRDTMGEGVGPVRVRRRDSQGQIEGFDTEVTPVGAQDFDAHEDAESADAVHGSSAAHNDSGNAFESLAAGSSIVEAAASSDAKSSVDDDDLQEADKDTNIQSDADEAEPELEPRRLLHKEYLETKRSFGESVEDELDFVQFNADLDDLAQSLMQERGCIDVRFELRIQDGTVALQPRLIREKSQPPEAASERLG